jgi:hypothetical protein
MVSLKPADELEHIICGYIVCYITLYYILLRASVENSKPAHAYCYSLIPCRCRHFNQHYRITISYRLRSSIHSTNSSCHFFTKNIYHTSGPIALYYTTDTESLQSLKGLPGRRAKNPTIHPLFIFLCQPPIQKSLKEPELQ